METVTHSDVLARFGAALRHGLTDLRGVVLAVDEQHCAPSGPTSGPVPAW